MKVEVKKVDALKRELRFEIPKDRVKQKMDAVYEAIGREAKIRGYRPGKAPRHVLESHHGRLAQEETIKQIIPEAYQEGLQKEKILPIDLPEIEDVNFKDGIITFTAKLDIKPEIKLKNYKGIKVERKDLKVTEEEINKTLEFFKKGQGGDKEVVLDDAFAHGLGYPSFEDFKKFLIRQMEMDKDRQNRGDIETQIIDDLIGQAKFTVPQTLLDRQLEKRLLEAKRHWRSHGTSDEDLAKKEPEMRKELEPMVERDIKAYLIFDKIAELENIQVGEKESMPAKVMELLLKEAKWEAK